MKVLKDGWDKDKGIQKQEELDKRYFTCKCGCSFEASASEYHSWSEYNEGGFSCECPQCKEMVRKSRSEGNKSGGVPLTLDDVIGFFEAGNGTGYRDVDETCLKALKEKKNKERDNFKDPKLKIFIPMFQRKYNVSLDEKDVEVISYELSNRGELEDGKFKVGGRIFAVYTMFDPETFEPCYRLIEE